MKKSDDNYLDPMENVAICLLEAGKLRRAEHLLQKLLLVDPNCLSAHFHLARVYRRTGELECALFHARRTLKLNPNERNAYLNLALIYELLRRFKLAVFYYKKELTRNPNSAETLWNIGRLYFSRNRWLAASKYLRRCFEVGFMYEFEDTVDKLGFCYNKLDDVQSYIEVYTRYVQMFPKASWAFANLGRALLQAKDYKGAILKFSRAKQLGTKKSIEVELARAKDMLSKSSTPKR